VQISGQRHYQKTVSGFSQLSDVFTKDDVARAFDYRNEEALRKKLYRMTQNHQIELIKEGGDAGKYRKLTHII
jgi:hypothetical protein